MMWLGRQASRNSTRNPGSKIEWKENFRLKIFREFGFPCEIVLFLEVLKNTVPFATGSCRKFKVDFLVEWKAPKVSLRKLFSGHCVFSSGYELIFILVGQFCKIDINLNSINISNP